MITDKVTDPHSGREFLLDFPEALGPDREVTFLLNVHGGGSAGAWQRRYFPAHEYADRYGLVVAAPTAATGEPISMWVAEADDDHLQSLVEVVLERFGAGRIRSFWLVGHSQGGMTCHRLLHTAYFADRVDGFLCLSGGRIGRAKVVDGFGPPRRPGAQARFPTRDGRPPWLRPEEPHTADFSFIYATGSHEIETLPQTSPWAERYGAGPRVALPDVVDTEPGRVQDDRWGGAASPAWGGQARAGTAHVYVYPGARDGRVIADAVRLDKGHTEGYEPKITERILELLASAPGGKIRDLVARSHD